jgi:hypothetical protein
MFFARHSRSTIALPILRNGFRRPLLVRLLIHVPGHDVVRNLTHRHPHGELNILGGGDSAVLVMLYVVVEFRVEFLNESSGLRTGPILVS